MPSFFTNINQIIKRNVNKCKTEKMVREDKSKSGKKAEKITKIKKTLKSFSGLFKFSLD